MKLIGLILLILGVILVIWNARIAGGFCRMRGLGRKINARAAVIDPELPNELHTFRFVIRIVGVIYLFGGIFLMWWFR